MPTNPLHNRLKFIRHFVILLFTECFVKCIYLYFVVNSYILPTRITIITVNININIYYLVKIVLCRYLLIYLFKNLLNDNTSEFKFVGKVRLETT